MVMLNQNYGTYQVLLHYVVFGLWKFKLITGFLSGNFREITYTLTTRKGNIFLENPVQPLITDYHYLSVAFSALVNHTISVTENAISKDYDYNAMLKITIFK